jgi:hypothetical protein
VLVNALRSVDVGRKHWFYVGAGDHAGAAGNVTRLIAMCKLHTIEYAAYLETAIRCVPVWPRDRDIELSPCGWRVLLVRLNGTEVAALFSSVTVPLPKA